MDLSKLNTTAAADSAQRFELIDPFTAQVLTDENDKPLAFHIVGMQSTLAKNEDAKIARNAPKPLEKNATDEQKAEHEATATAYYKRAYSEKVAAMITKLEGKWQLGAKAIKAGDIETLAELIESQEWLANQLIMRSRDLKNYRPKM